MILIDSHTRHIIDDLIDRDGEVIIVAYSLLDTTERFVRYILHKTFTSHGKEDLIDPVFSSIKELTTNAIKANIKQILIDEGKISNPNDPYDVLKGIKAVLNERSLLEYGIKCKERGLSMRMHINVDKNHFSLKIIDPFRLTEEQNTRMQQKIIKAGNYDDLAICYLENPDPLAEGMGLGLSMVVVLLKGAGIDIKNFSIHSDNKREKTIARLHIPFR
jgi:hypothetical protein